MILDADTANEIDDLYAIAYLLQDEDVDLLALSSAQWFHHLSGDSTVYQSQRLNEDLLRLAGREDLPAPLGSDMIMGKPWGGYEPRPSPATEAIIREALATPEGERLAVVSIGAVTNLASALALEPRIEDKIVAYMLGFRYNAFKGIWNKDEFNIRRDLNAANYLLNAQGLELHVMPISVAIQYKFQRKDAQDRFAKMGDMGAYLSRRWDTNATNDDERIMWDVALLQAFLQPAQAEESPVLTPQENNLHLVWMYQDIDEQAMYDDFWARMGTYH